MNILIVFDSVNGNTKKVALAIAQGMGMIGSVKLLLVKEVKLQDLKHLDLLIVGSPTHGGRPKKSLQAFLDRLPANSLKNIKVATFDTRFDEPDLNLGLRLLVKIIGFAAPKIAKNLMDKGAILACDPVGFCIQGEHEVTLKPGELVRAKKWGQQVAYI